MKIRKVTALIDTTGPDISGQWVQMLSGTTHLVFERDVEYFSAHPDAFTVSAAYMTVEALIAALVTAQGALTLSAPPVTTAGIGAKNGATVSVVEQGDGVLHKTIITCTATPVSIADDAGVAQYGGTGKLYDFPAGLINTLGAVIDGAVTLGTTGTIINTWAGGIALGTAAATTGATLVSTEADILPEVNVAAATAKVASVDAVSVAAVLTESGGRWLDGTATAKDLYLNLVVDDDATHTAGTGTFTGTITVLWANLGTTA